MASASDTTAGIHTLTADESFEELVDVDGTVLVDFYATWCGPCVQMEPVLETIADTTDATILKVDVDQHQQLAASFNVRGVPTMVVYHDGEQVERRVGYQSEPDLREIVANLAN